MWKTSWILRSCLKQKQHFCRHASVGTAVFVLGKNIFPLASSLQQSSPQLCQPFAEEERQPGRLPAELPVLPPEVVGMLLLPWGSRRAAGNQISHCWLFLVCARVSSSASLGQHGFCSFQNFAVPPDYRKCA